MRLTRTLGDQKKEINSFKKFQDEQEFDHQYIIDKLNDISTQLNLYREEQKLYHNEYLESLNSIVQSLQEIRLSIADLKKETISQTEQYSDNLVQIGKETVEILESDIAEAVSMDIKNADLLNNSMVAILDNIQNLDEGIRLLIAKTLLQNLEG